jgi:hypothetical protein
MVAPGAANPSLDSATRVYLNDGNTAFTRTGAPTFETSPHSSDRDSNQGRGVAVGDLTGDGALDIMIVSTLAPNQSERAGRVLVQGADGNFTRGEEGLPEPLDGDDLRGRAVALVDTDQDGDLDVIIGRDTSSDIVRNTRVLLNPVACMDFTAGANGFATPFKLTNGIDPADPNPVEAAKYLEITTLEAGRVITLAPDITYTGGGSSGDFRLEMRIDGQIVRDISIPSIAHDDTTFVHDYVRISFPAIGEYCLELRVDGTLTRRETITVVRAP